MPKFWIRTRATQEFEYEVEGEDANHARARLQKEIDSPAGGVDFDNLPRYITILGSMHEEVIEDIQPR